MARSLPHSHARDGRRRGAPWRTECTGQHRGAEHAPHAHQLARASRAGRARAVAALPCPGGRTAIHRGAPPVQVSELSPRALADVVVEAAGDKKAEDILVLNVSELP